MEKMNGHAHNAASTDHYTSSNFQNSPSNQQKSSNFRNSSQAFEHPSKFKSPPLDLSDDEEEEEEEKLESVRNIEEGRHCSCCSRYSQVMAAVIVDNNVKITPKITHKTTPKITFKIT